VNHGLVALRFLPNLDLVITLLALTKAGMAYIPLAPEWPQGRLELLIEEVRCEMIRSQSRDSNNNFL
jgi:non-ribosomal peptide synthetase component F